MPFNGKIFFDIIIHLFGIITKLVSIWPFFSVFNWISQACVFERVVSDSEELNTVIEFCVYISYLPTLPNVAQSFIKEWSVWTHIPQTWPFHRTVIKCSNLEGKLPYHFFLLSHTDSVSWHLNICKD